jgi:HPt (histidine-containing phosphotransfer) domain-containing protein
MTANAMQEDREACFAAGMNAYLSKPVRVEELIQALTAARPPDRAAPVVQPGLDAATLDELRALAGDDPAILDELIATFLEDAPALLNAMRDAIERQDADALRLAAHSLKSAGAQFGALALSAQCKALEQQAKAGVMEGATPPPHPSRKPRPPTCSIPQSCCTCGIP